MITGMFFAGFAATGGHFVAAVTVIFEARERLYQPDLQQLVLSDANSPT
jgi:hypothetical protein